MTTTGSSQVWAVRFTTSPSDQALLQAVAQVLNQDGIDDSRFDDRFSDLCKQALRQLLVSLPSQQFSLLVAQQQQLNDVQMRMTRLEQTIGLQTASPLAQFQEQLLQALVQLQERDDRLETSSSPARSSMPVPLAPGLNSEPEPDPLLSRLAPLLEDF